MKHLWGRKAQVEMIWQRSEEEKREMNEEVRRKVHEGVERKKKSKSKNKKTGKKEKSKQKNENKRGREEGFTSQKGKRVKIDMMSIDNASDSSSDEDDHRHTAFRDKDDPWRYDFIGFDE